MIWINNLSCWLYVLVSKPYRSHSVHFPFRHLLLTASLNCFSSPYLQADSVKISICGNKYFKQSLFIFDFIHPKAATMVSVQYAEVEKGRSTYSVLRHILNHLLVSCLGNHREYTDSVCWEMWRRKITPKEKGGLHTVDRELLSNISNRRNSPKT